MILTKSKIKYAVLLALCVVLHPCLSYAEEVAMRTIIPDQDIVRGNDMAVGDSYRTLSDEDVPPGFLVIEGNMDIGKNPSAPTTPVPNEATAGNLNVNDIYIRALNADEGGWASTLQTGCDKEVSGYIDFLMEGTAGNGAPAPVSKIVTVDTLTWTITPGSAYLRRGFWTKEGTLPHDENEDLEDSPIHFLSTAYAAARCVDYRGKYVGGADATRESKVVFVNVANIENTSFQIQVTRQMPFEPLWTYRSNPATIIRVTFTAIGR